MKITTHPLDRRPNKKCSSDNGGDAGVYVIYVRVCKSPKSARETRERERERIEEMRAAVGEGKQLCRSPVVEAFALKDFAISIHC